MDSLRQIRQQKGWSQKDLADRAGVGQDTISGIESGRRKPHPSTLRKLATALGVQVAEFFSEPALSKVDYSLSPYAEALPAEERSRSKLADAITSSADRWINLVSSPDIDEGEISGVVRAAVDLYQLLNEQIDKDEFEALTAPEQREIMVMMNKLAKVVADGLVRVGKPPGVSGQQDEAREQS